jgi:YegS/Rv2252/BmrU family lipid kinase
MSRAAVVVNPTKHSDLPKFRAEVGRTISEHGWDEPLWLETTVDDPGEGQARAAVAARVDLVVASGGDGTITACAAGLADSGIPLAVLPAGTGNLLARNLGLPLELGEALVVGLTGADRQLDMGTANGRPFLVMAGLGLDAKMLDSTSERLKSRLGWAAYAVSALRHLRDRPVRMSLRADGGPPLRRRASEIIVGNVGTLQGGVPLLPDAEPDDGQLDLLVLTARGWTGWLALAAHMLLRRSAPGQTVRETFRELRIDFDRPQLWEVDGEVMGRTQELVAAVQPGKLLLRVPRGPGLTRAREGSANQAPTR